MEVLPSPSVYIPRDGNYHRYDNMTLYTTYSELPPPYRADPGKHWEVRIAHPRFARTDEFHRPGSRLHFAEIADGSDSLSFA